MNKNELIKILNDWNFWQKDIETGIKRDAYLNSLEQMLQSGQIMLITGARRSGKSFLMRQLAKKIVERGADKNQILIVNFEDPRFVDLNTDLLDQILETYQEFLRPKEKPYIFLDEVQEVAGWEKWARTVHELGKAHIIISGSNAKLLSRELATVLTGRHLDLTVFPLSFEEFLKFKNISIKSEIDLAGKDIEIKSLLTNYLENGAFPKVVINDAKEKILLAYFDDILNKDLIRRFRIRKGEKIKSLIKFYLSNISSPVTFSSLGKFLGISTDTAEKFSSYLENAYMIFFLKRFSYTVKEQEKSPRKVYAIDTGLANTVGFRFSGNWGKLAENIVFLHLKRKAIVNPNLEIYYWKDARHNEADFVVKEKTAVKEIIQVCWNIDDSKTKKRETNSIVKAMKSLNVETGLVITEDYEGEEFVGNKKIQFIALRKWLLFGL
ncbi:ATP-binding protein [Patescibacteria group bacterium]|nr:ATP-binding protein [Patescibacteria group bacterium]MBU4000378.1 ATP-binding protein [Patescibacteria group bacterium]MBU4368612.1 ATP-binding protein [Patescibacteria group bacterium]